jgi:tRNA nucleotidyltransferase (CCA-adding enzyme)
LVRVLHSLSFIDDPTRILRAARLEQRLHFAIEPRTAELIDDALPMLSRVTGDRIRHEIELALREPEPEDVMARLDELGVWQELHPGLTWESEMAAAFARLRRLLEESIWEGSLQNESPASVYFALWLGRVSSIVRRTTMERLKVRRSTREEVNGTVEVVHALETLSPEPLPSQVERRIRLFQSRPRILLAARASLPDGPTAALLDQYQCCWREVEPALDGHDLREAGLEPGPRYGEILDALLAARLDGEVESEEEERTLLRQLLKPEA